MGLPQIFLETHNIRNRTFGFGVFTYELVKELAKQNKNFGLTLNLPNASYLDLFEGQHLKFHKYYSFQRHAFTRIRKKFDLWHSLNQNIRVEPYHTMPYLLTIHDIIPAVEGNKKRSKQFREKINRSHAITYISEFVKEQTHQYFDIPANITEKVIYNGNSMAYVKELGDFTPEIVPEKPFLLAIGNFQTRKNYTALIEMMRLTTEYTLILAGNNENSYGQQIKDLIQNYHLEKRVLVTGKISEQSKQYYLKNARALLLPSIQEGFGLPVVEAMHFGKPVFLSRLTSLPEVGGTDAFYWDNFDPEEMKNTVDEGLAYFYKDEDVNARKMKDRAALFSWKNAARDYLEIYESVVNK
ncbi:glycosyltransferase family 1 protein [Apibacter sp. HY039]|uniref:glycosyltransferase family 4 protein n=1 Tax=Apibacter sp. HY039 TaxID=2501476 RepID=UPI000FEBA893|nr:glycosyltransferase family 1 protein [Apibacter sp. HY039]